MEREVPYMKKADRSQTGILFDIQKFSVNDGPGIRTVVFFKGCPLRCRWCSNPESQLPKAQVFWDAKKCAGCFHCAAICPANAVSLQEGRIHISHLLCNGCGRCTWECPGKALEIGGKIKTVQEVVDIVLQDQVFYEEGGGITLSGGEFLSQPGFAMELLLAAKEEGLHTCCETTGFARPEIFKKVAPFIDYILFDMKHWNDEKHRAGTGVSNQLPLANMKQAIELQKEILPRIPVIPGFNDSLQDAAKFADTLRQLRLAKCQLLLFHQFGEHKYRLLGQPYGYTDVPSLHREDLEEYQKAFLDHGIEAFF